MQSDQQKKVKETIRELDKELQKYHILRAGSWIVSFISAVGCVNYGCGEAFHYDSGISAGAFLVLVFLMIGGLHFGARFERRWEAVRELLEKEKDKLRELRRRVRRSNAIQKKQAGDKEYI